MGNQSPESSSCAGDNEDELASLRALGEHDELSAALLAYLVHRYLRLVVVGLFVHFVLSAHPLVCLFVHLSLVCYVVCLSVDLYTSLVHAVR